MDIKQKYERRIIKLNSLLKKQEKFEKEISLIRLLVFIVEINIVIYTYLSHRYILLAISLIIFFAIFIYLVVSHKRIRGRMKYTKLLTNINNDSLKRIKGEWDSFKDDGEDFMNNNHNYSEDLDIFGNKSLFQWINTAKTYTGRQNLSKLLTELVGNKKDILERQAAVDELSSMLKWRQRFLAEGMIASDKIHDPRDLIAWSKEDNEYFRSPYKIALIRILPIITIILIVQGYILSIIPSYWPSIALFSQFIFLILKGKERQQLLSISERFNHDLRTYYNMLKTFEKQRFLSPYIDNIQRSIKDKEGVEAFKQIDELTSIINAIANRRNSLYSILNVITLWDLQTIIALEKWKQNSGHCLEGWLDAIGKIEALSSLAVIRFDNPDWAMPIIKEDESVLETEGIGHPLLSNRISNDITFGHNKKVLLITGSNMSGKSTLLRTSGINLVLAYAGAPVCAKYFMASIMDIYTCMRVSDNLSENISSFYAELLRIKKIISEAEADRKVFFLLDEIFKGTNSIDRHIGAKVLINKLSKTKSIGMVSTHDLELCELEKENPKIANYHFREYYEDDKINFDYKLRSGASTTRNAIYLMKLAGIDIENDNFR